VLDWQEGEKGNSVSTLLNSATARNKRGITQNCLALFEHNISHKITGAATVRNVWAGWSRWLAGQDLKSLKNLCHITALSFHKSHTYVYRAVKLNRLVSEISGSCNCCQRFKLWYFVSVWCFKESWCPHLQQPAPIHPVLPYLDVSQRTCCMMQCYIPHIYFHVFSLHDPGCVEAINMWSTTRALVEKRNWMQTNGMWCLNAVVRVLSFFKLNSWCIRIKCIYLCRIQVFEGVTVLPGYFLTFWRKQHGAFML
jgi:hypothetical protein